MAATTRKTVNFIEIVYEPGSESLEAGSLATHHGYEYAYALEGEVEVVIGDLMLTLSKNHSIGFDSSIPHKFRNTGTVTFRGIGFVHWCDRPRDWKLVKYFCVWFKVVLLASPIAHSTASEVSLRFLQTTLR